MIKQIETIIKWAVKHRLFFIIGLIPVIAGFIYLIFNASADIGWGGSYWEVWLAAQFDLKINLAHDIVFWVRKSIHFMAYGTFALFLWLYWFLCRLPKPQWVGLGCTALIAGLDEYLQSRVSFRSGKFSDVLLDISGALFMILWVYFIKKRRASAEQ